MLLRGAFDHVKRCLTTACTGIMMHRGRGHQRRRLAIASLAVLFDRRARHAALSILRPIAAHLWVVNLAVNAAALAWTARFYAATDAVAVSRALPLSGDGARDGQTLRVARAAIARYAAEERRLRTACDAQASLIDAQRAWILQQRQQPQQQQQQQQHANGGGSGGSMGSVLASGLGDAKAQGGCSSSSGSKGDALAPSGATAAECPVCLTERRGASVALTSCGHVLCDACAVCVSACPTCRTPVQARLRLFGV